MSAADLPPGSVVATDRNVWIKQASPRFASHPWHGSGISGSCRDSEVDTGLRSHGAVVLRIGTNSIPDIADLEVELAQTRAELAHADEVAQDAGGVDAHAEHAAAVRELAECRATLAAAGIGSRMHVRRWPQ